jgi:1,4-alpha-glucan branching enzyme
VSVIGDFNGWEKSANFLSPLGQSGIWGGFVKEVTTGASYQYFIVSSHQAYTVVKRDPVSFRQEGPPRNASIVWELDYDWQDSEWMRHRADKNRLAAPLAIYEVEAGSWMRIPEEENRRLTFRELAPRLAEYARDMGFTHVQFLPLMERPLDTSSFYHITSCFAPAHNFGTPQDLMYLIDYLHQYDLGVILDWVPSHLPCDDQGLACFNGNHLLEKNGWPLNGPDDGEGCSFDFSRPEVRSFFISSALFWLDHYHVDGLRLGETSSILYLDYAHDPGERLPTQLSHGQNLPSIDLIRQLNSEILRSFPDTLTIAHEATAWPMVTHTIEGGLGFTLQWDTEAASRTLDYFAKDPLYRKYNHDCVTSRAGYAFDENFLLPLSHDEVSQGRGSLLSRMPGDQWQRHANLRLLYGYMYLQPGKKLLFMGGEFAQWFNWNAESSLDWHLCAYPNHQNMQNWVRDLNRAYRSERALHETDTLRDGFECVNYQDAEQSTLSWLRLDAQCREQILVVCNFTPVVRRNFKVGVRRPGDWREILNSDAREYGGSGQGNFGGVTASPLSSSEFPHTLLITLPPLGIVAFKHAP